MQRCKGAKVKRCSAKGIGAKVQRVKVQRCKDAKGQGAKVQRCKGAKLTAKKIRGQANKLTDGRSDIVTS